MHVRPGVGAVVTQAHSEIIWGSSVLEAPVSGGSPEEALAPYRRNDVQVAAIDGTGQVAVHTGQGCESHAGHRTGDAVSAQVNTAQLPDASQRMVRAFQASLETAAR